MKIVLINNLYGKYARGGAERVVEMIVYELMQRKHEVIVVATKPLQFSIFNFQFPSLNCKILHFYTLNIISYYNLNKLPIILRPLWHLINIFNIQSYFKIKKIIKKEKPDLVMTHNLVGVGFLTPLAIKRAGVKRIHTLHDIQLLHPSGLMNVNEEKKVDSLFAKIYQAINKKLFASVDVVISPSEWLMKMHVDRGFFKNSRCIVIQNPIVVSSCSAGSVLAEQEDRRFIFLYVGQIEKHKGLDVLFNSFAQLKNDNYVLQIVGDGTEIKNYELRIKNYELNNIKFFGKQTSTEVKTLMQKADCLVVPSLCYENQPTVIIEALQNKLPVIASDIGGIPELLRPEFLFKAGDSDSLKNKIQWIIDNYKDIKNTGVETTYNMPAQAYIDKILSL